ncbi:MAG: hypothetical protein K0R94_290, partial [Burkholderiales bacterium]|nr:hypothetical protein [Burkholderiales bacterium]
MEQVIEISTKTHLCEKNLLNKEERFNLVVKYNQIDKSYQQNKLIHQLFEEQAAKTPNNIAVVYEDIQLTYSELNQRSNQLANYLRANYDIKADDLVALCLERNEHILIAILGVLKAGGAYVPIDPGYPNDRINFILKDTKAKVLITDIKCYSLAICHSHVVVNLDHCISNAYVSKDDRIAILIIDNKEFIQILGKYSITNPELNINSGNLAYVIYTSGTTGRPKGVMIEQRQLLLFILGFMDRVFNRKNQQLNCLSTTNYVFDIFGLEYIIPLINGNYVELANLDKFLNLSCRIDISRYGYIQLTPSKINLLFEQIYIKSKKKKEINILIGGEALVRKDVKFIHEYASNHKNIRFNIINVYGPTETTIWSTYAKLNKDNIISIGQPLPNEKAYILDKCMLPVPKREIGELYIGGEGLARGYLNLPELTKERFLSNPFQSAAQKISNINARIYKTGDLVRMLPDGNIEYIGRNDFQVKIRGFRIELGEIASQLTAYPEIKQAVVLAFENPDVDCNVTSNKYLVAYYVAKAKLDEAAILKYLNQGLPDYMVPRIFVFLEKLPLSINGKLNSKALPRPDIRSKYIIPRNKLDKALVTVFARALTLNPDKLSINADFFQLGGNSILAIKLINQLKKQIPNVKLSVADIFKYKNIEKLSDYIVHHSSDASYQEVKISKYNLINPEEYKLSFAQERLWFIDNLEQGTNAYNIPIILKLSESTNEEYLFRAMEDIVKRHEILRTTIKQDANTNSYQEVLKFSIYALINKHAYTNTRDLHRKLTLNCNYIFKLDNEYPIKIDFYKNKNNADKVLAIVIHHIAFDGWSKDVFLYEVNKIYKYYRELKINEHASFHSFLQPLSIQYKDYALWQREYLSEEILAKQLDYWKAQLHGYDNLHLMIDKPRPLILDYAGANVYFNLDEDISTQLRELAKELGISFYSVLLGCYYLLLSVYSNQKDIVIGAPVANRHYTGLENLIGFFVNTLAIRCEIDTKQTVFEYLSNIGNKVIDAQLHQDLPFEKLVDHLKVEKNQSRHPIFQVMFGVQSFGGSRTEKDLKRPNADTPLFEIYDFEVPTVAQFDITTMIDDSGLELAGSFNYRTSLYNHSTIENLVKTYKIILENIVKSDKHTKLSGIKFLSIEEYNESVISYNQIEREYSEDKIIHKLFEEQVAITPNNIAVVYEDIQLTYKELNKKANQFANYLRSTYHIKADDLVALCLDRSEYMLIAILGVLKAGAAYMPIDPGYPDERITYILEDTQVKVLITDSKSYSSLNCHSWISGVPSIDILSIDNNEFAQVLDKYSESNPKSNISSSNLAYVIYTSGTTGKPKGVMIEHKGALIRVIAMIEKSKINANSRYLFKTNYVFDVSFSDIFTVFTTGGSLYITKNIFDIAEICNLIRKYNINICHFVPSQLYAIYDNLDRANAFESLKTINLSGEGFNKSLVNKNQKVNFVNYYGPTETGEVTFDISNYNNKVNENLVTIGYPIHGTRLYILNSDLNPLPVGSIGELYIGGVGLARGYLNLPELTKKCFLSNPFQQKSQKLSYVNSRIYKTGDLVRMLPDGNIEYIGRNDFQVKIRGFRIELSEIESQLTAYPEIKQAVVLALEQLDTASNKTGNKYLVGYYVTEIKLDEAAILNYLNQKLPDYMIPNILIHLDKLPLTINGKLDRKALPNPEFLDTASEYIAPRDELDRSVVEVFAGILGLEADKLSITTDFFRLGGNSILAIKLVNELNKWIKNAKLVVADIFKYKNIEKLSDYIVHCSGDNQEIKISKYNLSNLKDYKLSFAQERLWFIDNLEQGTNAYNIPIILKLLDNINEECLFRALEDIVKRHEILRTIIKQDENSNAYQEVLEFNIHALFKKHTYTDLGELHKILTNTCNRVFKLDSEYPIKIDFYQRKKANQNKLKSQTNKILAIVIHHIAFDGWSIDVLLYEINLKYKYYHGLAMAGKRQNHEPVVANLSSMDIQYKDYALWQRENLSGEMLNIQLDYWKAQLSGYENLHLMTDKPRPLTMDYAGANVYFRLVEDVSKRLRDFAKELGVSLYSVLLAAYYLLLSSYSN